MRLSLDDWLHKIQGLTSRKIQPDLEKVRSILKKISNFSSNTQIIIVTGTNGKGTTVELITQMLLKNRKTVGTFSSPHLFEFNERIRVNGSNASDKEITDQFELIERTRGDHELTFFEYATLTALSIFSNKDLDYLILEVGIGGSKDTVNIMDADISVITNIDLDHQRWLGNDLDSIGKEKAGVFRKNKPVILGEGMPSSVIDISKSLKCPTYILGKDFYIESTDLNFSYQSSFTGNNINSSSGRNNIYLNSLGIGMAVLEVLDENLDINFEEVLDSSKLPGRCDLIDNRYIFDVSHNPASANFLRNFIDKEIGKDKEVYAIIASSTEKDLAGMVSAFDNRISEWFITEAEMPNPMSVENIALELNNKGEKFTESMSIMDACLEAEIKATRDSIILVFGSFYTVSQAYQSLRKDKT